MKHWRRKNRGWAFLLLNTIIFLIILASCAARRDKEQQLAEQRYMEEGLARRIAFTTSTALAAEKMPNELIEAGFNSWSLFLVSNPAWLQSEREEMLHALYRQFRIYGAVIGPKHLAVWFSKISPPLCPGSLATCVDLARSSQYCSKYKLLPSEGPHILVTTTYPNLDAPVGDYFVVKLNGADSADIIALITKLSDQLLVEGLDQAQLDSEQYWRKWQGAYVAVREKLGNFIKKVTVSIDTKFFKVEIVGGGD